MRKQYLLVARHGLREDERNPAWIHSSARPWDPPLASEAYAKAAELAAAVQQYDIEVVVSSPYLRCLQTTAAVCKALQPPITRVQVDNTLCEIAGRPYFVGEGPVGGQTMEQWMWAGGTAEEAWRAGLGDGIEATSAACDFPQPTETLSKARSRYANALHEASERANGKNLLIVSHGEAVGVSVTRLLPTAVVHQVQHCGFTVAWREEDGDGDWGFWNLEEQDQGLKDQKGVVWRFPSKDDGSTG